MRVFVVSAGHSDVDPGAVANGVKEADVAEDLRNIVASKLRELGHTVITDGDGDVNQPLSEAVKLINRGELAIEIHCNAAGAATATGVESISLPKLKCLSQRLSKAIAAVTKDKVRGDDGWIDQSKSARGRLAFVNAGGIIIELFFLTNKHALAQYNATKWLVASAIAAELVKGA
ncbi:N-acetylmuramoyl-L-alanine amidase [Aeromonas hydrophila]|uniref:N-acetylmuramoyl-L-alanine amidase n=1 Tax=Aeromonas hydrophila TaxID=644 RepID=UPI002362B58A|nr:N-acetylmuramoyl-L-alanine amidase [Aeromonas hydrophila]